MTGRASSSSSINRIVAIGRDPLSVRCVTHVRGMNMLIIYTTATILDVNTRTERCGRM